MSVNTVIGNNTFRPLPPTGRGSREKRRVKSLEKPFLGGENEGGKKTSASVENKVFGASKQDLACFLRERALASCFWRGRNTGTKKRVPPFLKKNPSAWGKKQQPFEKNALTSSKGVLG